MKFKIVGLMVTLMLLTVYGCFESVPARLMAYTAGEAVGYNIIKKIPESDAALSQLWNDFADTHRDKLYAPPEAVSALYRESLLIIASHDDDPGPYLRRLDALFLIIGADYSSGNLILNEDVPMSTIYIFQRGYVNGRYMYQNGR